MGFFKPTDGKTKELNEQLDNIEKKIDDHIESCSSGSGSGEGLTTEQAQQLQTAYEHSQTAHVQASDIPSLEGYATETFVTNKIAEASLSGGEVDLSGYAKTTDVNKINNELRNNRFSGLKVLVEGDSITEANFRCERNWHDFLSDWLGFGSVINKAVSGTGFISKTNGAASRITSYPTDVDLILMMGCMNDLHYVREGLLGTFDDDVNSGTVYGGLHNLFTQLLNKFPNTPIMVITSQPRAEVEDNPQYLGEKRWGKNCPAYQINEALKEVCEHYTIPCLDLYSSSFIKPWITSNRNRLCPDGVHPNTEGQYVMAEQILPFVRSSWIPTENFANANVPLQGISMSHSTLTLEVGKQFTLNIIPTPSNASNANVTWRSSDSTKVKVEEAVLTGLAVGTSTITATSIEGEYTTTCEVTVVEAGEGASIVSDGLVVYLDALDNTENSTTWSSRVGDLSCTLSNFNTTTSKYNATNKTIELANKGNGVITGSGQSGTFTAECLLALDSFNCSSTRIPFSNYNSSSISGGIGYLNRSTSVEISDRTSATKVIASTTKDGSISTNYVLITITVDNDKTTKLYLNGELKGSGTCNGFSSNDFILNHTTMSGTDPLGFASFRIYNRALTQSEIQTNLEAERMTRTF